MTQPGKAQYIVNASSGDDRLEVMIPGTTNRTPNPEVDPPPPAVLRFPRRRSSLSVVSSSQVWRGSLAASIAACACGLMLIAAPGSAQTLPGADTQAAVMSPLPGKTRTAEDNAIRPFHINFSEEALVDLRRRIAATRWPDRETVTDQSQGVQL